MSGVSDGNPKWEHNNLVLDNMLFLVLLSFLCRFIVTFALAAFECRCRGRCVDFLSSVIWDSNFVEIHSDPKFCESHKMSNFHVQNQTPGRANSNDDRVDYSNPANWLHIAGKKENSSTTLWTPDYVGMFDRRDPSHVARVKSVNKLISGKESLDYGGSTFGAVWNR